MFQKKSSRRPLGRALLVWPLFVSGCLAPFLYGQPETLVSGIPPENPELVAGVRAALSGDDDAATKEFADAMTKHPGSRPGGIDAAMAFAGASFDTPSFGKLRFWLEKTAEDFPDDPEAFLLLAEIALADGRYLECSMLTERAAALLDRSDADPERRRSLGIHAEKIFADIAERRERWGDAVRFLTTLNGMEPENGEYLYRLGLARYRLGEKENAVESLTKAEAVDRRILPALVVLAQLSEYDGKTEEAAELLAESLKKHGDNPRALVAAADLELKWNRLERVREYAEKAKRLDPESVEAEIILGILDLYAGRFENAEETFSKILERHPDESRAMTGLALALCEQEEPRQRRRAFALAKRNADDNPNSVDAQTTLAWVLVKSGSLEDAEKILMRQFDFGEMNSPGAYYLAVVFSKRNRKDEAVLFLKNALETNVNFPKRAAAEALLKELTEENNPDGKER